MKQEFKIQGGDRSADTHHVHVAYLRRVCVAGVRGPKVEMALPLLVTCTHAYLIWVVLDWSQKKLSLAGAQIGLVWWLLTLGPMLMI